MILRLLLLSIASETLYLLLAASSLRAPEDSPLASLLRPTRFEETLSFLGLWAIAFLVYGLAVRATSARKGATLTLLVFLTSAAFRLTFLWGSELEPEKPSVFLDASSPLEAAADALEGTARSWSWPRHVDARAALAVLFDLGALALAPGLLRAASRPTGLALVHGWNPLLVKEVAGNGRLEMAAALFFLIAAMRLSQRRRSILSALSYGAALTGPLYLWATLPLLAKALRWRLGLSLAAAAAAWGVLLANQTITALTGWPPRDAVGGSLLPALTTLNRLLLTRNDWVALWMCAAALLAIVALATRRLRADLGNLPREALLVLGSTLFLAPQVMPWAFLSVAALAAHTGNRGWLVFTATAPLTYLAFATGDWSFWLAFTQYFPAYASLIFSWLGRERD